jgi:flavin reductase (DIM6/NTAB) family NADH-FMN oxidoreductase RutF
MAIGRNEFLTALRQWASGVTVVTTKDAAGTLHGITVSAFSSVSLAPPLVLICIEKHAGSHHAFAESRRFVVNILSEAQQHISQQFAAHLPDKFADIEFEETADGIPILTGALANLECRLVSSHESGDHTIFVGEIESTIVRTGEPLVYFEGQYRKIAEDDEHINADLR